MTAACPGLTAAIVALSLMSPSWSLASGPQAGPPPPVGRTPPPTAPSAIERLGKGLLRIGSIRIDSGKREISVPGTVNDIQIVEFIANTKGGFKAYESAIELDANGINFNLALILIGLDKAHAVAPRYPKDPNLPAGDPVEIWIEWTDGGTTRRVRAEELVYNRETKQTLPEGAWVYTGSTFVADTTAYQADVDGVLIGFAHTPAAVIDRALPVPEPYDANRINSALNLKPGTAVVLTVRALTTKS